MLLRCRAIENQCYVIAAAQTGQHNEKRRSYGHAMVRNLVSVNNICLVSEKRAFSCLHYLCRNQEKTRESGISFNIRDSSFL